MIIVLSFILCIFLVCKDFIFYDNKKSRIK